MRRSASLLLVLLLGQCFPVPSSGEPRATAANASPLDLEISGPRVIRIGQDLHFQAILTNRSAAPIAVAFRPDGLSYSVFKWSITDLSDRVLSPPPGPPVGYGVCYVSGALSETEIHVLLPGEKYVQTDLEDPSNEFAFRGQGFYKVKLRYAFGPGSLMPIAYVVAERRYLPDAAGPYPNRELLTKTPPMDVTSNVWSVYLAD